MNNVKLLHIKCCFFQFSNSPVAMKKKKFGPQEKVEMTPLICMNYFAIFTEIICYQFVDLCK